jgi:hypothetical protein
MPIGGAEETEPGGKRARIAVIPTASEDPQRSGEGYAKLFTKLGAGAADWLRVERRDEANTEEALSLKGAPEAAPSARTMSVGQLSRLAGLPCLR